MKTLIGVIFAFIFPLRWTSRLLLLQELRAQEVDTSKFSKECLQEFADKVVRQARLTATLAGKSVREEVVDSIEGEAVLIAHAPTTMNSTYLMFETSWTNIA